MPELPRKLGLFDGAALFVGSVIGSGIFIVPALIAQRVPEPGLVIAIWLFSGLLVLCGALTLAELGTMLPQLGACTSTCAGRTVRSGLSSMAGRSCWW